VKPSNSSGKRFLAIFAAGLLVSAISSGFKLAPLPIPKISSEAAKKLVLRNNAASLLDQLLDDEKGAHYILLINGHREELQQLIKKISATADAGAGELAVMAKTDPALNLHALDLPAGEKATRAAIETTQEHELLFTSGADFEFTLLLTQADALSYGWHLAQIAADNSSDPAEAKAFTALSASLQDLYKQTVALMRSPPAN
jgi:hypothetical protein